jgi:hypothetical protein
MNKKNNLILNDWLNSLTVLEFKQKKSDLINKCFITYSIFVNWKLGKTPIPKIYFKEINLIAGKEILKVEEQN